MSRRDWKRVRATSAVQALRLCKEFAQERHNLSVERIADRMGVTHDSLYKWLATGRLPAILVPAYELACGCSFLSVWFAATAGKMVIDMPTGRKAGTADVVSVNTSCAEALPLLTAFYANPSNEGAEATLAALRAHMEQVAFHHHNVARYQAPQLEL
ncbi:hypothetical protein [Variovorax sp.]|uniref:hypothetical protein n=1 Tax=Variovorax sp. TaxID=1871043 RepID=UPI003BAADCCC